MLRTPRIPKSSIFCYSWNTEREAFILLWLLEGVIGVKIEQQPDQNDNCKRNKSRAVFHACKKWEQKDPEDNVIGKPDQRKQVNASLLDWKAIC